MKNDNLDALRDFYGPNAGYVLELYDLYKQNPHSVDPATRVLLEHLQLPVEASSAAAAAWDKVVAAANLAQAIRDYGHLAAHLDPLGAEPPGDASLQENTYALTEDDLRRLPAGLIGGPAAEGAGDAQAAIHSLRSVYCSTTGYEYSHVVAEERAWLREAAESRRFYPSRNPADPQSLLRRLTEVEAFEVFLQRIFPGKFRFSLEGLDMLVPMLDEIIRLAAEAGIRNALLGMGHRGRLNVLAQVLNKRFEEILAEFKDPLEGRRFQDDLGWTGDVKYHIGAIHAVRDGYPVGMSVTLAPNPSHVEAVNPVVEGMARAAGSAVDQPGPPRFDPLLTLPLLIHGDAAFTGQGVVAETLNLGRLPGYTTGGTIHIIANNQLGFTTEPREMRSTLYASDLAKGFEIPIVHVNADDPEACLEAARTAFAYRAEFQKDFLIDLVGYRRRGHNETDEPSFTQPLLYRRIKEHPTARELWAKALAARSLIDASFAGQAVKEQMSRLQQKLDSLHPAQALAEPIPQEPPRGVAKRVATSVPEDQLRALGRALWKIPSGFLLNPKIERAMERRKQMLEQQGGAVDWTMAEELAFASLLEEGVAIRLTGEDSERGTFSQRHAIFRDMETGKTFVPLQSLPQAKASFEICNSPLTENAVVGFEYGYCIQKRDQLVIWEAQYGDFVNGAQVMIDEFVASGRAKWGQVPSLVLLLPHAYEGQGPNHSSAHLERLLQLAADQNLRAASCTTAAQYFHLLRRQALLLKVDPLPLAVLTPKSLLRHPQTFSRMEDLGEGSWQPVLDDPDAASNRQEVQHLILCHGKVFVDLTSNEQRKSTPQIAIVRIEQIYPYPAEELESLFGRYRNMKTICWVQEEPENMGAWDYLRPLLRRQIDGRWPLSYVGRPPSSSPAEGSGARHAATQQAIIEQAFHPETALQKSETAWMEKRELRR